MKHPRSRCRKVMSVLSSKGKDISKGFSVCAHFPKCLIMVLDYEQPLDACESAALTHCKELWRALLNSTFSAPGVWELARRWQKKPPCIGVSLQASTQAVFGGCLRIDVLYLMNTQSSSVTFNLLPKHDTQQLQYLESKVCNENSSFIVQFCWL